MFTTDEDQKRHLEKEAHGQLCDEETIEDKQEKLGRRSELPDLPAYKKPYLKVGHCGV